LRFYAAKASTWVLRRGTETVEIEVGGRFRLNSVGMLQRLAKQGLGITVLADEIAAEDLANGHLVHVLPQWNIAPVSVYAITETRLLPAKTQRFIEFLRDRLGQGS
jgi:DNA-binding transcriptional LysR family regulator